MMTFYKFFGVSLLALTIALFGINISSTQIQATITPVPTARFVCIIGDTPYVLVPVRTIIALTASPTFIGPTPTRIPSSTPTPLDECAMSGIVTATTLNVRAGPSASFAIVGSLKADDMVTIAETKIVTESDGSKSTWLKLCAGGWVNAQWVRLK